MSARVLADQGAAVRAVRPLLAEFGHLPAAEVHLSMVYPDVVQISVHDDLPGFEAWREALGVDPESISRSDLTDRFSLRGGVEYAGVTVELIGYAALLAVPAPEAVAA